MKKRISFSVLLFSVILSLSLFSLVTALVVTRNFVKQESFQATRNKIKELSEFVAGDTEIKQAIEQNPQDVQDLAQKIQETFKVDFVVIVDKKGLRLSHPNAEEVGKAFSNQQDIQKALQGKSHYSTQTGILGEGYRYFYPIRNQQKQIIAVVCVGLTTEKMHSSLQEITNEFLFAGVIGGILAIIGSFFITRYLKKVLLGLEPYEIAAKVQQNEWIENTMDTAVLAINLRKEIIHVNRYAQELLTLPKEGQILDDELFYLLFEEPKEEKSGHSFTLNLKDRQVVVRITSLKQGPKLIGYVASLQDRTQFESLANELAGTKQYVQALRARTHDFRNKLQVINGLVELGEYSDLKEYIKQIHLEENKEFGDFSERIGTPALTGFLLGKAKEANERKIRLVLHPESQFPACFVNQELVTLIQLSGNLIDNAMDALENQKAAEIIYRLNYEGQELVVLEVQDNGTGMTEEAKERMFQANFSTKGAQRGFGLSFVKRIVHEHDGFVEVTSEITEGTTIYLEYPVEMVVIE